MLTEFEFLKNLKSKSQLGKVGDDCAVLPKNDKTDLLVTADMLVEDIDFRLDWTTPEFLGHKALAVSISDIAAMGGTPVWSMLSIGIPEALWSTDFINKFYKGWFALADQFNVELVGGDVSKTPERLVIDSIVGGEVPKNKAVLRSKAQIGDAIVVSGCVGGSAGGLKLLQRGERSDNFSEPWMEGLLSIHLRPSPQVSAGNTLLNTDLATAMIDISDGLLSDLEHVCESSHVGAKLFAEKIPLDPDLRKLCTDFRERLDLALNGGEDFQLLFTIPKEKLSQLSAAFDGGVHYPLFNVIGEITANFGRIELIFEGNHEIVHPQGYMHF